MAKVFAKPAHQGYVAINAWSNGQGDEVRIVMTDRPRIDFVSSEGQRADGSERLIADKDEMIDFLRAALCELEYV